MRADRDFICGPQLRFTSLAVIPRDSGKISKMSSQSGGDDDNIRPEGDLSSDRRGSERPFLAPTAASRKDVSDEDLADQLANGEHDALSELFERYSDLVFGIARRMLKDDGEAEEALQQIFLDTYRAIHQFDRKRAPFKTWLLQFVYHRTINRKHHLEAKGFYSSEEFKEEFLPIELFEGRTLQLCSAEVAHLIGQLLGTIKARQRRTIELTFFEGLTAEEIAKETGETPAMVRHNLYRGLSKLRSALLQKEQREEKVKKVEGIIFAHPRPF
jgi:RNA polymerase sigma-70 factor (ECF subfamily)